jgi:hypothetical protein
VLPTAYAWFQCSSSLTQPASDQQCLLLSKLSGVFLTFQVVVYKFWKIQQNKNYFMIHTQTTNLLCLIVTPLACVCCRPPDRQPTTTTGHHTTCCNFAVLRSWWWANACPKHVELILKINKYCYLLHLVGLDFITLPTLKMHGQTQIKFM